MEYARLSPNFERLVLLLVKDAPSTPRTGMLLPGENESTVRLVRSDGPGVDFITVEAIEACVPVPLT